MVAAAHVRVPSAQRTLAVVVVEGGVVTIFGEEIGDVLPLAFLSIVAVPAHGGARKRDAGGRLRQKGTRRCRKPMRDAIAVSTATSDKSCLTVHTGVRSCSYALST